MDFDVSLQYLQMLFYDQLSNSKICNNKILKMWFFYKGSQNNFKLGNGLTEFYLLWHDDSQEVGAFDGDIDFGWIKILHNIGLRKTSKILGFSVGAQNNLSCKWNQLH